MYERSGAYERFLSQVCKASQRGPKSGGQRRGRRRQFTFAKGAMDQMEKRSNVSKVTTPELAIGMQTLNITSPYSPHTHLSLPLPIINDPLDEIFVNLNL